MILRRHMHYCVNNFGQGCETGFIRIESTVNKATFGCFEAIESFVDLPMLDTVREERHWLSKTDFLRQSSSATESVGKKPVRAK